jgi:integrase
MSARPFTESEYSTILAHLAACGRTRDRLLILVGCATGFRIRELTSLTWAQVHDPATGDIVREVTVARRDLKGGRGLWRRSVRGRRVPLSETVRTALRDYRAELGEIAPGQTVFATGRSGAGGAMHRSQAWRIIFGAAQECGVDTTRISTHSCRKLFVLRAYLATGKGLVATMRIVGHSSPTVTSRYLETDSAELDRVVLGLCA